MKTSYDGSHGNSETNAPTLERRILRTSTDSKNPKFKNRFTMQDIAARVSTESIDSAEIEMKLTGTRVAWSRNFSKIARPMIISLTRPSEKTLVPKQKLAVN